MKIDELNIGDVKQQVTNIYNSIISFKDKPLFQKWLKHTDLIILVSLSVDGVKVRDMKLSDRFVSVNVDGSFRGEFGNLRVGEVNLPMEWFSPDSDICKELERSYDEYEKFTNAKLEKSLEVMDDLKDIAYRLEMFYNNTEYVVPEHHELLDITLRKIRNNIHKIEHADYGEW